METTQLQPTERRHLFIPPRLVFGLFLVVAGTLLTLDNLGYLEASDYLLYWPGVLIVLGVLKFLERSGMFAGAILTSAGTLLLLDNLGMLDVDPGDLIPVLIILLGGFLVWKAVGGRGAAAQSLTAGGQTQSDESVQAVAVMSGVNRKITSQSFRGGELTAIMGGCEIDLTQAKIAGSEAVIDTFSFWGGVVIRVPESWSVDGRVTPLLGGYEDKTRPVAAPAGSTQRLVVQGLAIMGGVEVKN